MQFYMKKTFTLKCEILRKKIYTWTQQGLNSCIHTAITRSVLSRLISLFACLSSLISSPCGSTHGWLSIEQHWHYLWVDHLHAPKASTWKFATISWKLRIPYDIYNKRKQRWLVWTWHPTCSCILILTLSAVSEATLDERGKENGWS